jgi:Tol biopolymer transport system component
LEATPAAAATTELIAYTAVDLTGQSAQALAISPNGGNPAPLASGPADSFLPMYSPDGARVALIKADLSSGDGSLWVAAADGSGAQQVTQLTALPFPTLDQLSGWSPNGKLLAFTRSYDAIPGPNPPESNTGRVSQVWVVDVATHVETRVDPSDAVRFGSNSSFLNSGVFSPDSSQVVFHTSDPNPPFALGNVFRAPVTGGATVLVTAFAGNAATAQNPVFSPDGSRIAFTGAEDLASTPSCGLYSVPAGTVNALPAATTPVAGLACPPGSNPFLPQPYYSPNGATIALASGSDGVPIRTVPAAGGTFTPVTTTGTGITAASPLWSPDSTRLVYTRTEALPADDDASLRIVRVTDPAHSEVTLVHGYAIATSWRAGSPPVAAGNPCIPGTPAPAGYNLIEGTNGADRLVGTPGSDLIRGLAGNDRIIGKAGADILCGNGGKDRIVGGKGVDVMFGGGDRDVLFGGRGGDRIFGEKGDDRLLGGSGRDYLDGGRGDDRMTGGAGRDSIHGGPGKDTAVGGPAADRFKRVEDHTQ